jgi:hypothetical protein
MFVSTHPLEAADVTVVPPLLKGLVDDAAVFPPCNAPLSESAVAKRGEDLLPGLRARLATERPLWIGVGTCDIAEPLDDLRRLGLLP